MRTQNQKAKAFHALHHAGKLLILPNIWNPVGAKMLEHQGYPAVATASAALSASLGYLDGEKISRNTLLEQIGRIANSVDVPVTADIESGYGESTDELKETIRGVIDAGIVGINIEDSTDDGEKMRPIDEQCEHLAAVREAADEVDVRLFINARIDAFMSEVYPNSESQFSDAITRAKAFLEAGANGVYPIGPGDEATIKRLRKEIDAPINILAREGAISLKEMQAIGINRVTFGPYIFRSCYGKLKTIAQELKDLGAYDCFIEGSVSGPEMADYLNDSPERTKSS
ncbi:MAG: isocitrate lyase/phosphoenolpyruvate mutase family protein [Opitutales bacterium]|nr:isocitrate lyase/phosphoenolpyruvate mutase family protein [Opitutales bacterium]